MPTDRLQKILAQAGIASRRAAEALITGGRVRVNGRVVDELGAKADPQVDRIEVDGRRIVREDRVYIILHKPRGVVTTMSDPEGRPTVKALLDGVGARVVPVGRLDFATSGALLATNDGDFAAALLHPRGGVPKEYVVKVHGVMKEENLDTWRNGIELDDGLTLPAKLKLLRHEGDKTWIGLELREGRNQQIRRMGEASGFPVMRLARISFAGVDTQGLAPGRWRALTRDELLAIRKAYGVPKRLPPAAAAPDPGPPDAKGVKYTQRPTRTNDRARAGDRTATEPRGSTGGRTRTGERTRTTQRTGTDRTSTGERGSGGARYGGGAPGRRSPETTEDWSGGTARGRGRSSGTEPRPEGGGRGGRTRTTGTAGGVGTTTDAARVKSRRGR